MVLKTEANEKSIEEIERKLSIVGGDMLKIEYLENALKKDLPLEVRKYVHIKLSDLYVKRLMYGEAARKMGGAGELSQKFKEKKELFMKQVQLLIKNLNFDEAEKAYTKANQFANTVTEKAELRIQLEEIYKNKASELEKIQNNKKASYLYEKLLALEPGNQQIKQKLLSLYSRIGKVKEAISMENSIKNPAPIQQQEKKKEFNIDEFLNEA